MLVVTQKSRVSPASIEFQLENTFRSFFFLTTTRTHQTHKRKATKTTTMLQPTTIPLNMDTSSADSTSSSNSVSWGNVSRRVYEREIDYQADIDLGLTIGWKFNELSPVDLNSFTQEDEYREAEIMSEGERAQILLENGFSRRQLRSAIKRTHRRLDKDVSSLPKAVLSAPARILKNVSKGAKRILLSPMTEDSTYHSHM